MNFNRIYLVLLCPFIHILIASATTHTVVVAPGSKDIFDPVSLTINVGDTVQWTFQEDFHTVTSSTGNGCSSSGLFDSGVLNTGNKFSFTFKNAGTFNYMCLPHCEMGTKGVVVVNE
ncbi:plastocyanin/azurin family copper-binding protein, partial [Bacillus altitudinis]|uniref:cupredoxin domain-containing protein n=1 Tax=Bacillus altitudinis TaxID=293387 RepID=UPI002247D7C0